MVTRILVVIASIAVIGLIVGALVVLKGGTMSTSSSSPTPTPKAAAATPGPGLVITDEVVGTGTEAKADSTVSAKYTGTLADGTVFDSTDKHGGDAISFPLSNVIKGWQQGIPGMKVGGKRKLVIPGDLAYGANPPQGSGIPANATLTFDIELVDVK